MVVAGAARRSVGPTGAGSTAPDPAPLPATGALARTVIRAIRPQVDNGRRPAKAAIGQRLRVEADAFADGHDVVRATLRVRHESEAKWTEIPMVALGDDRFRAEWPIVATGWHKFVIRAAVDPFVTWRRDIQLRHASGQDIADELAVGAALVEQAARRASRRSQDVLRRVATALVSGRRGLESPLSDMAGKWNESSLGELVFSEGLGMLMEAHADPAAATSSAPLPVFSDRARARCSAWYELFPRSTSPDPRRHGTFSDVQQRLDEVERMGFDVLYLPPIHPIGQSGRKGPDGAPSAGPQDPGSPWAIGSADGGHREVHPELGTLESFASLVRDAAARGIDVAIDLAFQASPDHPWVTEHPSWFRHRPDGTIRYAENPPKTYEDIYPLHFESDDWQSLWLELLETVQFWIAQGVTVFRVDNPHTKPFAFWEWLIASVKRTQPEVIFLAEAFTRPAVMEELARVGFSQSYTYFTWRTTKWELETYLGQLTHGEMADYFRPNFWPNTPDILSEELQHGGRPAFVSRLILAATLSANYGIYGPAFELQEHVPRSPGSEEYRRSEKYEIRNWERERPDSLADLVSQVNAIRRAHPALQYQEGLCFHRAENDQIIAYSKRRSALPGDDPGPPDDPDDIVLVLVNLDHDREQTAWVDLDLDALGLDPVRPFVVHDLLTDAQYQWQGARNFVILNPVLPAHVFSVRQSPSTGAPQ
jgi:starch synthase (maltosyl-transferring)